MVLHGAKRSVDNRRRVVRHADPEISQMKNRQHVVRHAEQAMSRMRNQQHAVLHVEQAINNRSVIHLCCAPAVFYIHIQVIAGDFIRIGYPIG